MTDDNRLVTGAERARVAIAGDRATLRGTPRGADIATPGQVTVILGTLPSGAPLTITTSDLEWLDDLDAAIQYARARGVVQAGMTL